MYDLLWIRRCRWAEHLRIRRSATDGPLVAAFTHAREPYGQAIAYSNDNGRTWGLFAGGSHVVPNQRLDPGRRDPKVFWHAPSTNGSWCCGYLGRARFFAADDMRHWRYVSDFEGGVFYECPDLFELPIDEDLRPTRWVLHDHDFSLLDRDFRRSHVHSRDRAVPGRPRQQFLHGPDLAGTTRASG